MSVRVEGLKALDRALSDLSRATAKNVTRRALKKAAEPMAQDMARRAPRDSDELSSNVGVGTKLTARQAAAEKMEKGTEARVYIGPTALEGQDFPSAAGFQQEFGNINHPPQPFVRPAFDAGRDEMLNRVKGEMAVEIEKAVARATRRAARNK